MDKLLGVVLNNIDSKTRVIALSDHGFCSFRRQFNLNAWLAHYGYARLKHGSEPLEASIFTDADWPATKAYGLGMNGLYLNLKGREPEGVVSPGDEAEKLKDQLISFLQGLVDVQTGQHPISRVCRSSDLYSGPLVNLAPDLVVCYNRNYRSSWNTGLGGGYGRDIVEDNLDPWSGDHALDSAFMRGVLLMNRPVNMSAPCLENMAQAMLREFGANK